MLNQTGNLESLQERFIDAVGRFAKEIGITGYTEGRVFGYLMLASKALSQDDLVDGLQISRGKVSTALKILTDQNFVKKTGVRGSRKEFYAAELNLWKVTLSYLLHQIGGRLANLLEVFEQILADGNEMKKNGQNAFERRAAAHLVRRVEKLQGFARAAQSLLRQIQAVANLG